MTKTIATPRVHLLAKTITRNLLAALALGMLFTACKKNDDDGSSNPGNGGGTKEGYYPSKTNTVWKYRTEDDGEVSEHNLRVVSQKDSAGGKVVHYQMAFDDGSRVTPFVHATSSQTTFGNALPSDLTQYLEGIAQDPDVSDLSIAGFPMLQRLPANPKVGDAVQFSEALHIGWIQHAEGEAFPISMEFAFSDGRIVGIEDVTTPAGTFRSCVKWQHKATLSMQVGNIPQQGTVLQNTLWYAKGVGLVKSSQTGNGTSATTTLIAVQ